VLTMLEPVKKTRHDLKLIQRKQLDITGILKLESFDKTKFRMETECGFLTVSGQGLAIKELILEQGILVIEGQLTTIHYGDSPQQTSRSFWRNVFR
jgi:sporulation protein YabP